MNRTEKAIREKMVGVASQMTTNELKSEIIKNPENLDVLNALLSALEIKMPELEFVQFCESL